MGERVQRLELAIDAIQATVAGLEDRIAALELGSPPLQVDGDREVESATDGVIGLEIDASLAAVMGTPTLLGRSLLVLAGAFLLRALTEREVFVPEIGVALGLAYGAVWIVVAALAARKGARASAGFYAVCSAVIGGPLLFEAATSFDVLSPTTSAVALAGVTSAGLFVSVRWRLQASAWIFSIACLVTAAAVATVRSPGEAITAVVVVLGVATLWIDDDLRWNGLKWMTAFAADLAVLRLTAIATMTGELPANIGPVHPAFVAMIQGLLVMGFVGTFVIRSMRGRTSTGVFEFVQTAAVWIVGWGGAIRLAGANAWSTTGLATLALAGGVAAYAGAFGVVDRKHGRNVAFVYLSSLGLGLVLVGSPGVAGDAASMVWASLAVGVAAVGSRWDRVTLRVHAAVLIGASWIAAGVVSEAFSDLVSGNTTIVSPSAEAIIVACLTLTTTVVAIVGRRFRSGGWMERLPLTFLLLLAAVVVAVAIVEAAVTALPAGSALGSGTVALSLVTVGLAILAKRWGITEAGWLVYPLLVLTGMRLVARDLPSGQTLVLVIALAAYGCALIVSTRMLGIRPSTGTSPPIS